jgi:hypothetical protein
MVRDVFHLSGLLRFDPFAQVSEIVLNQHARRAHVLIRPLRELLAPSHIVVSLGESIMSQSDVKADENGLY